MKNRLSLVWATEVDAFQLGARLEAYADTRPAIEAFRLCDLKLPAEVIDMVIDEVRYLAYVENIGPWLEARRCYKATCTPESHYTVQELHDYFSIGCSAAEDIEKDLNELGLSDASRVRHNSLINTYIPKFLPRSRLDQTDKFDVCQQVSDLKYYDLMVFQYLTFVA